MERKVYDYFDGETMPDDCVHRIESRLASLPKVAPAWHRFAAAAAAVLLMVALCNQNALRVNARKAYDFMVNAFNPDAGPVGQVEEDIYISFSGSISAESDEKAEYAAQEYLDNQAVYLAESRDGRLYFIANGENIDITDQCSMDTAFIYVTEDNLGYIHYLCVGGTPENWGEEEYIWNPALGDRFDAWKGGSGYNTWNYETDDARWPWVYDARERCGFPFDI